MARDGSITVAPDSSPSSRAAAPEPALTHTGAETFFTLPELMAANLRAPLAAYAGLWTFPAPAEVPTDPRDREVRLELRRRLTPVQFELFGPASAA